MSHKVSRDEVRKTQICNGGLGRTQVHRLLVTGESKGFIDRTDDQGRAGRVNRDRQEFGNQQAIR